jgi:hypothetical protein
MKRLGHFEDGKLLTAGEKALVVMLAAGVFGYWAGFNLSTPGVAVPFPVAAASARPASPAPARVTAPDASRPAHASVGTASVRDDPPKRTF